MSKDAKQNVRPRSPDGEQPLALGISAQIAANEREHFSETVRNSMGEFGDRLIRAEVALRDKARKQGLVVKKFTRTPAKVVGEESVKVGKNEDGSPIMHVHKVCEITVTAHVAPAGPERWIRLTTSTGPAAVEVLETEGGQIKRRYEYHPEDVRNISWGFAETALTETAGP